ncbi:alkylhydroperoxidase [Vibrio sp. UCD-FRSSP16_10]|uniref:carboxymuconolactone decarboxylase family protein n=1 Tax=unclassified Vibrio TaxID=2614977 RepID=UPI0007FF2BDB|nr:MULTISPECIES: carboxymuconolactone decarboxylase family protein [unclassified Vibrio]OBT16982.1 alkylhydroperoxidase [Vibrio sp. UCD-FRSSP16_30]OBT21973.1 alkylhydroperoxidase [Vibrio sp. UCD-FRSSP16_10]
MTRVNIYKSQPGAYKAFFAVEAYLKQCAFEPIIEELIRVRTSQLNGCSYCIHVHTKGALAHGESQERIFALPVWKESVLFSEKERSVLSLVEEMVHIYAQGITDNTYVSLQNYFTDDEIGQLIVLCTMMNAWNRLGVATHANEKTKY